MRNTLETCRRGSNMPTDDCDLDRLLHPARFYRNPRDVVEAENLSLSEKRAILSSWASDACAVDSMPTLRKPPGLDAPISFDEVMEALQLLDKHMARPPADVAARSTNEPVQLQ